MIRTIRIAIIVLAALTALACSPKVLPPTGVNTTIERRDSIVYKDSLIYTPVPLGKHEVITSTTDTSKVETQVAFSIAYVDSTGVLHHSIENKPVSLEKVVSIPSRFVWLKLDKKETLPPQIVQIEKPLSWWQKFRIGAFWWLLGGVVALLLWTFRKLIFL